MLSANKSGYKGPIVIIGIVLVWEIVARLNIAAEPLFFPPFSKILLTFIQLIYNLDTIEHALYTIIRSIGGLIAATCIAIPVGLFVGYSRWADEAFTMAIEVLRPIPPAAIIPVAILFLGIHDVMKLAVITFGCIWPILINTIEGVKNIDRVLIDTGRMLNLGRLKFFSEIVIMGASPYIVTGVRISLSIALILDIVVEMIAGNNGLGFFIIVSERSFRIEEMYAGILSIAIVGFTTNKIFVSIIEQSLMYWHHGYRAKF